MSFSQDVKLEIVAQKALFKNHKEALAYGLLIHSTKFGPREISITTQLPEVGEIYKKLIAHIISPKIEVKSNIGPLTTKIWVADKKGRERILEYFTVHTNLLADQDKIYAYLSGAFLSCGNITDPYKGYHLEYVTPNKQIGEHLRQLLETSLPSLKTTSRRSRWVVYTKERQQIQDALTMMGASQSSLEMIEVEIFRDIRNRANRLTNAETANIDKIVAASTSQVEDIQLIFKTLGKETLSLPLLETAKLRLENPYASLRELSEISPSPISRSGLNNRLQSLGKLARELRQNQKE